MPCWLLVSKHIGKDNKRKKRNDVAFVRVEHVFPLKEERGSTLRNAMRVLCDVSYVLLCVSVACCWLLAVGGLMVGVGC